MASRLRAGIVVSAAAAVFLARETEGHAFQVFPISRQYSWSRDIAQVTGEFIENAPDTYSAGGGMGKSARSKANWSEDLLKIAGFGNKFPLYFFEHLGNGNYNESNEVATRRTVCGDPRQGNVAEDKVSYSTPNSEWEVLGTFERGAEIEMIVSFGADHKGHFEFFLCDTEDLEDPDGVVTQECLNKHPLDRVANKPNESPVDPNYIGRWYSDPPCRADTGEVEQTTYKNPNSQFNGEFNGRVTYRLPDIECSHCVLQMVWHTGHTCYHVGYPEFNPTSWNSECAPNKEDWMYLDANKLRRGPCGVSTAYPQEFWSCSDIALVSTASTTPAPSSGDTPAPSAASTTPAPSSGDTPAPSAPTTYPAPTTDDPVCSNGLAGLEKPSAGICCAPGCSQCGGDGCSDEGASDCCTGTIAAAGQFCDDTGVAPCILGDGSTTTMADDGGEEDDDDEEEEEEEEEEDGYPKYLGCFLDAKDDRVLVGQFVDKMMTTEMCMEICEEVGAVFAATQFGSECWCSDSFDIMYDRHGDDAQACDIVCAGNKEEICGGFDAFNLYQLEAMNECHGVEVLPYEQCGGSEYDGPTCCTTDHGCTAMPGGCYSQCRPTNY